MIAVGPMLLKMLTGMAMKLLSEKLLEELLLWCLKKLAESTKTKVDNELLAMVEKHLAEK